MLHWILWLFTEIVGLMQFSQVCSSWCVDATPLENRFSAILSRWMDNPKRFCRNYSQGDNFCRQEVASIVFETFQKWGLLLNVRICWSKFLHLRVAPNGKGWVWAQIFPSQKLFPMAVYLFSLKVDPDLPKHLSSLTRDSNVSQLSLKYQKILNFLSIT